MNTPLKHEEMFRAKRDSLLEQRSHIDTKLNELTHAGRLPPELLSAIFKNICPYDPAERTSHGVLAASQVCRRWRAVAVSNPLLWTHVELDRSPGYIKMVLKRSRDCLVDVSTTRYLDAFDSDSDDEESSPGNGKCVFPLIWDEIHRVRSFILLESLSPRQIPASKLYAPQLQTYLENYTDDPSYYDYEHSLLPFLDAPRLRRAKLIGPSLSTAGSLPELLYLELVWEVDMDGRGSDSETHSFNSLMKALGCLPRLSTLRIALVSHLWRSRPQIPHNIPTVSLERLQLLEFVPPCDIIGVGLFLEHTKLPLSPRVMFTTENDTDARHTSVQVLATGGLQGILRRWSSQGALNLGLHLRLIDQSNDSGADDIDWAFSIPSSQPINGEVYVSSKQEEEFVIRTCAARLPELDIDDLLPPLTFNLRELCISAHQWPIRIEALQEIFRQLEAVEAVTVANARSTRLPCCRRDGTDAQKLHFIGSNLDRVFTATTFSGSVPLLPNLVAVRFTNMTFTGIHGCATCYQRDESQDCTECRCKLHHHRLVSWLMERRKLGVPVARLIFDNCSELDEVRRTQLRFIVTDEVVEISDTLTRRYRKI